VLPGGDSSRTVSIAQVLADEGAVVLALSGVGSAGPVSELVLEVSRKPLMNLVWGGSVIIILGTAVSFWRRRREAAVEPSGGSRI
jgi:cytochrome c biogenesis factor